MRAGFRWNIPENFNISERCCDSWAKDDPERVAVTHVAADGTARDWTYGDFKAASDRLATSFQAQGVRKGDRIAVLLGQGPEVLISHFAAYKIGAVLLPLFTLFGPDALQYRLRDSGALVVVTDPANFDKVASIQAELPGLKAVYVTGDGAAKTLNFWAEIDNSSLLAAPVKGGADDPALLVYTSGTTGPPKGVLHAHRVLMGHLPSMELHHEFMPQAGDKGWTPADWAWVGGLLDLALPCLYYGIPLVSHRMRKFDPDAAYALIAKHKIRNLFLPPTALKLMRQADVPEGVDIRTIGSGGESLGAELLEWANTTLKASVNELYGQTECNLVLSSCQGSMQVRPGSMGLPVPGHDVAVIDSEGNEVAAGEIGEIAVRRPDPVMFLEYWQLTEKTKEKFVGDWLKTGDLAVRDADGYFTFVSRDDDVITSSGYRIGPSEIEHCLMGHADVVMAAVIGVPDPVRTEIVKAFVVLRDGVSQTGMEKALTQLVRDRISPHLAPREVVFVKDLPMTATGKIMRRDLRKI
ncbi:MAG TPA: AMP-dependent synthetase [Aliiroseovarius sp.]|nr:AMP-dependent synthetase [Aliiroseovarius sp.]